MKIIHVLILFSLKRMIIKNCLRLGVYLCPSHEFEIHCISVKQPIYLENKNLCVLHGLAPKPTYALDEILYFKVFHEYFQLILPVFLLTSKSKVQSLKTKLKIKTGSNCFSNFHYYCYFLCLTNGIICFL